MRWVEENHEKALGAFVATLTPQDRHLYEQVILPSSWYPFESFVRINQAIDARFGRGDLSLVPELARFAADRNLPTLYRFFYSVSSVSFILSMASRLWRVNYDAGELKVDSSANEATLSIVGFPEPHRVHCLSVLGWASRSAELSGAKEVVTDEPKCRARGEDACVLHLRWK